MRYLGRGLQLLALLLLPLSMVMEATDFLGRDIGVADMLIMLVFGIAAFSLGRMLEGMGARA